jgi:deaminated glutathione amidase
MRAACLQLCSGDNLAANLDTVARLLGEAVDRGAQLALLPENFAFMGGDAGSKRRLAAEEIPSTVLPFLADQARRHGLYLVGGSVLLEGEGGRLRNSSPVFGPDGSCLATYDKIHLFDIDLPGERHRESELIQPGAAAVWLDLPGWRLGLSICYDLRFPELYRQYASAGCQLLSIPAAFTVPTGAAHWEVLLRARAIENQAFVLAPAQGGQHPGGRRTYGHSLIVDPWGEVLARGSAEAPAGEVLIAELEPERLQQVRQRLPALRHRRLSA